MLQSYSVGMHPEPSAGRLSPTLLPSGLRPTLIAAYFPTLFAPVPPDLPGSRNAH